MHRAFTSILTAAILTCALVTPSFAQATRTWVSGVGDDANPCSRTAPCKTFPGAISKTAAGGEISVLDPGGFGTVTITKAITIDGQGQLSGILSAGVVGVTVNAGPTDVVILRNLSIDGAGSGTSGIRYVAGGQLIVDSVAVSGITLDGIDVSLAGTGNLIVTNSTFTQGAAGIKLNSGVVNATLSNVSIRGTITGVDAVVGTVDILNSVISQNSAFGVLAEGGVIDIDHSMFTGNAVAIQAQAASTVRVSDSDIYNNLTGFGCGAGTLASAQNNRKGGNGGGGSACAPNLTITIQ